jgi:hypothetical protein
VTFKDLKKRVSLETSTQLNKLFEKLRNKPFWIWNVKEHKQQDITTNGDCCFNHVIGLPTKESSEKPIFDYQQILHDTLVAQESNNLLKASIDGTVAAINAAAIATIVMTAILLFFITHRYHISLI